MVKSSIEPRLFFGGSSGFYDLVRSVRTVVGERSSVTVSVRSSDVVDSGCFDGFDFEFGCFDGDGVCGQRSTVSVTVSVGRSDVVDGGSFDGFEFEFGSFDGFDFVFGSFEGDGWGGQRSTVGVWVTVSDRSSNTDGGSFVRNGDGSADVLNDWGNGGIGVSFLHRVGEVASQTVRADDGAVVARCTHHSCCWDHKSLASHQAHDENCYLKSKTTITCVSLHEFLVNERLSLKRTISRNSYVTR